MNNSELAKKNIKAKLQDFFTAFVSLFVKKEKLLSEAPEELTTELDNVNSALNDLIKDDSFEGLKSTYEQYRIGVNPAGGLIAVEKSTGYINENPAFVSRVRFVSLWRKSAFGNLDSKDEEDCFKECFSSESKGIFEEIKGNIQNQLVSTGNINTLDFINCMKDSNYKWGRVTSRRLFRTNQYAETVDSYFRSITSECKKQTKPTDSLLQAIYGLDIYD